jgi:uncharacterized membrane protein (UPF0136 family)
VNDLGRNSLLILSVFVLAGGMAGYAKAKSKASLIAGVISSVLLGAAFAISLTKPTEGLIAGVVITTLLDVVFGIRLAKTKAFMPGGLMLSLCLVTQVILIRELLTQTVKIYPTS